MKGLYLRDKVYWMRLSIEGRIVRKSTGTSSKRLAEDIFMKVRTLIAEGKWLDKDISERYTFDMLMAEYFSTIAPQKSKGTQIRDKGLCNKLTAYFTGMSLSDLSLQKVERYKAKRLSEVSPATVKNELRLLSHALRHAKKWKWIRENPLDDFTFASLKARSITRFLTPEEENKLMQAAEKELNGLLPDIILFALNTGASGEEIIKAKWQQFDLDRRVWATIRQKTQRPRNVPLNNTLMQLLGRLQRSHRSVSGHLWHISGSPVSYTDYSNAFRRSIKRSGIEHFRPHDCRHTFASRLVQAGRSLYEVAMLLGHSSLETTKRYAHLQVESLHHAVNLLDTKSTKKAQFVFSEDFLKAGNSSESL